LSLAIAQGSLLVSVSRVKLQCVSVYTFTLKLMRTNIELDDALVAEAFRLTTAKTKKELIHQALETLIQSHKKKNLLELAGKIQFSEGYDYKALRTTRHADD
jgi:Arc/MetJ family transcription regulator